MAGLDPSADATFRPFPIWIAGTPTAAVAAVAGAPGGDLPQTPLHLDTLEPVRGLLAQVRAGALDLGTVAALGRGLFAILFTPALRDLYQQSRGVVAARGERLRVLLCVDVPELAALPWELLCDPQATGPTGGFLALDPRISLARYLPQDLRPVPPPRHRPLRVLAVFAGPRDQAPLDLGRELRLVSAALGRVDPAQIQLDLLADPTLVAGAGLRPPLGPPTPDALRQALDAGYEVLHYAGHGLIRPGGEGFLALEDAGGNTALYDAPRLALAVSGSPLRLAVLAACDTAAAAPAGAGPAGAPGREALVESGDAPPVPVQVPLAVAPALIGAGLGAVVAMQFRIPDASAVTFSQALYTALSRNDPVDAAVAGARKALRLETGNPQADWAIPVLFLQEVGDGRLWQTPAAAERGREAGAAATPAPGPPGIQTGNINSGGGAVAVGGNVTDSRVTHIRHGGIEFAGPTTISGPVVGGDVQNLTMGGPPGLGAAAPPPARVDFSAAFAALVAEIDDDTLLAQARVLRTELLAPQPRWTQLRALQTAFVQAGLQAPIATFFADPTVRPLVTAAKVRSLDPGGTP